MESKTVTKNTPAKTFNIRLQKYKKNRLNGMLPEESMVNAGFSPSYARSKAWRMDRKANVSLKVSFGRAGLTDGKLVQFAMEGLNANKVISANIISSSGEGMADANSSTRDFIDVPDWLVRHKFFESICRLTGRMAPDGARGNQSPDGAKIIIVYPPSHNEPTRAPTVIEIVSPRAEASAFSTEQPFSMDNPE